MGLGGSWAHPPSADLADRAAHELQRLGLSGAHGPRAKLMLEKMDADLRPANMAAAKLTGASPLREFLEHQLAPLWQYSLPMWRPHPSPAALADGDLAAVLQSLVGGNVARLEGAPTPLFLRDD